MDICTDGLVGVDIALMDWWEWTFALMDWWEWTLHRWTGGSGHCTDGLVGVDIALMDWWEWTLEWT